MSLAVDSGRGRNGAQRGGRSVQGNRVARANRPSPCKRLPQNPNAYRYTRE